MFRLKLFNNQTQENVMAEASYFSAYKSAFDEAVKNYNPLEKSPYITIKITSDFPNKKDVMEWNRSLTQLYEQINTNLKEYMSDYNTGIKKCSLGSSGWRHAFTHLLHVKGIEAMQQFFAENCQVATAHPPRT